MRRQSKRERSNSAVEVVGWIWKRPAAAAAAAHDAAERGAATGPPGRLPPDRRKSLARSCVAIIPTNNKPAKQWK